MIFDIFTHNKSEMVFAKSIPMITYNAHLQNVGWQGWVSDGKIAGTTGQNRQMEALRINLSKNGVSMITYRAHVQHYGWLDWVQSGETAGTTGQSYRLEGVQIKLKDEYKTLYDVYYRMHLSNFGWLGWAKNGETAGSTGIGVQAEAIEIKIVSKKTNLDVGGKASYTKPLLSYRAHCANIGWMNNVNEAEIAGTTGQSRQLEALVIQLDDFYGNSGVIYRAHVSNIGWQEWKLSNQMMGTTGQGRKIEAVEIQLTNLLTRYFDIYYRVHVSNVGWLGWAKNGETAGSTGQSLAIEAIEIKLELKENSVNVGGSATYQPQVPSTANGYDQKVNEFINSSKWCNGAYYGSSQTPLLTNVQAKGCCAYATDFVKYVYGKDGISNGIVFYSPNQIKTGDVIKVTNSEHWFVVLYRNGSQLTTAEGNWTNGKVLISNNAYTVQNNKLLRKGKVFGKFSCGYHFQ